MLKLKPNKTSKGEARPQMV